jgi:hypothetical protein
VLCLDQTPQEVHDQAATADPRDGFGVLHDRELRHEACLSAAAGGEAVRDDLQQLIDEWLRHYIDRFAVSDIKLAAQIRWAMRHATIVGGPRDGQIVAIQHHVFYEPLPPRIYNLAAETPRASDLTPKVRRYRLERLGKPFALNDPLQSHTTDFDLDPTYGNRYVLDAP